MLTVIAITLRETMEMLLVILALVAYVSKLDKKDLLKYIYSGAFTGLGLSIISGLFIYNQINSLQGATKEFFLGSMMLVISVFILYYIVWMRKQKKLLGSEIGEDYNIKATAVGFFIFSLITIFRESIEIIIFIVPLFNTSATTIIVGGIIGSVLSLGITYLMYSSTIRLNIDIIFSAITLMLIFLGAQMFAEGIILLFPSLGDNIQTTAQYVYTLPALFIFLKSVTRDYIKKK